MPAIDPIALYQHLDLLNSESDIMEEIMPVMLELLRNLESLPRSSYGRGALPIFKRCIVGLNRFEDQIETVERESLLEVIYRLGELVGLSRSSEFVEEWRGDW